MSAQRPRDPWFIAAVVCLFAGAMLLVVAWYDISGTANVYEQLPYLVSAGFTGLALIIVGAALLAAGRADRVERRLAQLIDALTVAAPKAGPEEPAAREAPDNAEADGPFVVAEGGQTYHRPDCLLLRDKSVTPASEADIVSGVLTPCPVCAPSARSGSASPAAPSP